MSDIYKYAVQYGLRFPSIRGMLTSEQLFSLPLKSTSGFDLDTAAREVNAELKGLGEESFVEDATVSPRKKSLEVSLEILKDVIKTKQEEKLAQFTKLNKAAERKKILDVIYAKKDQALSEMTQEDLEKKLAALDE